MEGLLTVINLCPKITYVYVFTGRELCGKCRKCNKERMEDGEMVTNGMLYARTVKHGIVDMVTMLRMNVSNDSYFMVC